MKYLSRKRAQILHVFDFGSEHDNIDEGIKRGVVLLCLRRFRTQDPQVDDEKKQERGGEREPQEDSPWRAADEA